MREIKFRALVGGQWFYGDILNWAGEAQIWADGHNFIVKNKETIGQYTGLKDKNGVEIYEGDIVEYKAYNIWHRDEVKFTDGKFHGNLNGVKEELQSRYDLGLIVTLGCEVIGNIYEHGHLLENESKE